MFPFPLGASLLNQEPLLIVDDAVYVKTRRPRGDAVLTTAHGFEHPLRRSWSISALQLQCLRDAEPSARCLIELELQRMLRSRVTDPLIRFLYLADELEHYDFAIGGETSAKDARFQAPYGVLEQIDHAVRSLPMVSVPSPSLCILGRLWLLADCEDCCGPGLMSIRAAGGFLRPTGEFILLRRLRAETDQKIREHCARIADAVSNEFSPAADELDRIMTATAMLQRAGWLRSGSLIYVPANGEEPGRVGHILPHHFSKTLGRNSSDDLIISSVFDERAQIDRLKILERDSSGRWKVLSLRHGLCLGPRAPSSQSLPPLVRYGLYLRWAAVRISQNGRFHEHEDADRSAEPEDQPMWQ